MRSRVFPAFLLCAAAACAPSSPPASAPAASAPASDGVPPVLGLLDQRERLALSADQVVALEGIARDWEAANDTLARRIGAVKGRAPSPLRAVLGKEARVAREAIEENNRRTSMAVARVLRPRQRDALCTTERLRHETAAAVRTAKAPAKPAAVRQVRASKAVATVGRAETRRAWPWCASVPARAEEARTAS